jgi:hypothetical protein
LQVAGAQCPGNQPTSFSKFDDSRASFLTCPRCGTALYFAEVIISRRSRPGSVRRLAAISQKNIDLRPHGRWGSEEMVGKRFFPGRPSSDDCAECNSHALTCSPDSGGRCPSCGLCIRERADLFCTPRCSKGTVAIPPPKSVCFSSSRSSAASNSATTASASSSMTISSTSIFLYSI